MNKTILIVDDAAFMRLMLRETLSAAGFNHILEAKTGLEAVAMYKANRPQVVILDIIMPGKDGFEALKEIKEYDPNAKIIICSSMEQEDIAVSSFDLGADDFIMKPFKPERIIQAVSQFMDSNA